MKIEYTRRGPTEVVFITFDRALLFAFTSAIGNRFSVQELIPRRPSPRPITARFGVSVAGD